MNSLLWHLTFHLIPRGSDDRIEIDGALPRTIGNAELTPCWHGREGYDFGAVFDPVLPRCEAEGGAIQRWGSEADARVEVWRLPQGLSVYVRVHIISCPADTIERLMRAARGGEMVIVLNDLRVIEAAAVDVMAEIQNLSAARFLASPTLFLKELNAFA